MHYVLKARQMEKVVSKAYIGSCGQFLREKRSSGLKSEGFELLRMKMLEPIRLFV
jgi:hypothetical protein